MDEPSEQDAPATASDFITTKQAAGLLGINEWSLRIRRNAKYSGPPGPPWYRRMGRIYYKTREVLGFLAQRGSPAPRRQPALPRVPLPPR